MRPIRSERRVEVVHDPWHGAPRMIASSSVDHALTDQGAVVSTHQSSRAALACGCVGQPPGGYCGVCTNPSAPVCARCFRFCVLCLKPLCPRHSVVITPANPAHVLCSECAQARARHRAVVGVFRWILSPFVEFDRDARS